METMTRMVPGLGLEEKGGQTGDRVARREEEKEKSEEVLTPDRSDDTSAEDRKAVREIEGEQGTEGDTSRRRMEVKIYVPERRSWQRTRIRRTRTVRWGMR